MNPPNSRLFVCVGIPGSGKTFWSKQFAKDNNLIRLSSDELRGLYGKDETDQSVSKDVFRCIDVITRYFLKQGKSIIVDATHYRKLSREKVLKAGRDYNVPVTAVVFRTPFKICFQRNKERARCVPEFVLQTMTSGWEEPTKEEGFFNIADIVPPSYL